MKLDNLINITKTLLYKKINTNSIPPDEVYDILQNCIVDILSNPKNELSQNEGDLKIIEHIIDKNIVNYVNQVMSPPGSIDILPYEFEWKLVDWGDELKNDEEYYAFEYKAPEILKDSSIILLYDEKETISKNTQLHSDLIIVNNELINFLKRNPNLLYKLNPQKFEEIVAELLSDMGYAVELTKKTRDGGVDIFATQKTGVGETLLIVDCKRYSPHKHIGVSVIRSLYGITEQLKASMGLIATTSYFSKPAVEFKNQVKHRISLKDYKDITAWLNNYNLSKL